MIHPRRFHPCGLEIYSRDDSSPLISSLTGQIVKYRCIPTSEVIPDRAVCKFKMTSSENLHIAKRNGRGQGTSGRWTAQNAKNRKEENLEKRKIRQEIKQKKNPAFSSQ